MIATRERVSQRDIFQLLRSSIQELHPDKVILEDVNGTPFLFKSQDAEVWARIFYRSMRDYSVEELQQEIKKLWVLMPNDATLYLFYPELSAPKTFRLNIHGQFHDVQYCQFCQSLLHYKEGRHSDGRTSSS